MYILSLSAEHNPRFTEGYINWNWGCIILGKHTCSRYWGTILGWPSTSTAASMGQKVSKTTPMSNKITASCFQSTWRALFLCSFYSSTCRLSFTVWKVAQTLYLYNRPLKQGLHWMYGVTWNLTVRFTNTNNQLGVECFTAPLSIHKLHSWVLKSVFYKREYTVIPAR